MKVIYFESGTKGIHIDFTGYIPVYTIHSSLTVDKINIMLQVFCITNCSARCAFYGIAKKTAFNVMMKDFDSFQRMKTFLVKTEEVASITFVEAMYRNCNYCSLNEIKFRK